MHMTRRALKDRNTRKLGKSGASYSLTLPLEFIRELKWRNKQKLVVEKKGKTLVIKDWEK